MRYGSVCSGIEAASVAWEPLGWEPAWFAEIEPFPSKVLAHHWPDVPNLGDMTTIADRILADEIEAPDVLCGGTPCQAFSVAGLQKGLSDARGQLSLEFCRLADAIDTVRQRRGKPPCVIIWENVPGVYSTDDGTAFGSFLGALAGSGDALQPPTDRGWMHAGAVYGPSRAVCWRTLNAEYFGVAQRRNRVWVVASAGGSPIRPEEILFEWEGRRRDSAPSREAGEAAAPTIAGCSNGGGANGPGEDGTGRGVPICIAHGQGGAEQRTDGGSPTLTCNHEAPIVCETAAPFTPDGFGGYREGTGTLKASGGDIGGGSEVLIANRGCHNPGEDGSPTLTCNHEAPIVYDTTQITSAANGSQPQPGDPCHPLAAGAHPPALVFHPTQDPISSEDVSHAVTGSASVAVLDVWAVRRLMPVECERLQGFPDGHTAIGADTPRYKAIGNSWAVPCARWIGQRIQEQAGV